MNINMDEIAVFEPVLTHEDANDTLVIDNGTYKCKAGFQSDSPQMTFRNRFYKYKDAISLHNFPLASIKTMFERDLVINSEIFECTLDLIIKHLYNIEEEKEEEKPSKKTKKQKIAETVQKICLPKNLILTQAIDTPKMLQTQLLSLLFEVYQFEKVQFGNDAFYSYLYNIDEKRRAKNENNEFDMVISSGHYNTIVYLMQDERIVNYYKMPFGGQLACEYLITQINNKYPDVTYKIGIKEAEHLVKYLEASIDYKNEAIERYNTMKNGHLEKIITSRLIKYTTEEVQNENKTKRIIPRNKPLAEEKETEEDFVPELDIEENKIEIEEKVNYMDKDDADLTKEQIKEKRRQKMIYYSSIYRYKQKIEKEIRRGKFNIEYLEEELEKSIDINKYLAKIKKHYQRIKREILLRDNTKRELKNKRSVECLILMKANNGIGLFEPEQKIYNKIQEAGDEEAGLALQSELVKYRKVLENLEPLYLYETTPVAVLRGDHIDLQGFCADIELMKATEILFQPSIIGMQQPGLKEIFGDLRHLKFSNILLTGSFSQIKHLDKRIEYEINQNSTYGLILVLKAKDAEMDSFKGAVIHKNLPTYTLAEYKEIGAEKLIEKCDHFC